MSLWCRVGRVWWCVSAVRCKRGEAWFLRRVLSRRDDDVDEREGGELGGQKQN